MDKNQEMWKRVAKQLREQEETGFEEFYILTYQPVYQDIIRAVGQEEKAEKLLIDFYVRVYRELPDLPDWIESEEDAVRWLESILYEFFEIQADGGQEEDILQKRLPEERAATLFFQIEDKLGLPEREMEAEDDPQEAERQNVWKPFACLLAAIAGILVMAVFGTWKVKDMISRWDESMKVDLETEAAVYGTAAVRAEKTEAKEESEEETEETENEEISLQLAGWKITVADDGSILETERETEEEFHGTVQSVDGWSYVLVQESQFPNALPELRDCLVRIPENGGRQYEVVASGVEDFCIDNDCLYYAGEFGVTGEQLEEIPQLASKTLVKEIRVREDGFYLLDDLGEPEAGSSIQMGDRVLRVENGRIKYAAQAVRTAGGMTFYLADADQDAGAELCWSNGTEAWVLEKGKIWIDSFCMAGDWVYFSAYEERDEADRRYSRIYRVKTDGTQVQPVTGLFQGNVMAMYYFAEDGAVYGEFKPDSYHSYYGQIVRISLNGEMQVLDNRAARSAYETTGNDVLELIDVKNGKVYCYWHDCSVSGSQASILWTRPLVLG
ncbi:MAG TPA: hypothetical protein IAA04_10045 [Candidatus Lachnoclostridium pullistercoris]|uniref:DUF5050 domain-containing protein n=1 Tax=Candidatus Lachnoclostridium pullistercoris TaxID=2838632 RepID=A0A9D2PF83_9FIRM|nr:hypothetical protein [Candidatus Lachnoclostridium pullistercoris]